MKIYETLGHTTWECKYHVVFIPKCRRKVLYGQIRGELGRVFRELAEHRESEIEEGHLMSDHVHMLISVPPKYSVSQVMGYVERATFFMPRCHFDLRQRAGRSTMLRPQSPRLFSKFFMQQHSFLEKLGGKRFFAAVALSICSGFLCLVVAYAAIRQFNETLAAALVSLVAGIVCINAGIFQLILFKFHGVRDRNEVVPHEKSPSDDKDGGRN